MNFTAWCLCSLGPGKSAGGGDGNGDGAGDGAGDGDGGDGDTKQVSYALFRESYGCVYC